MKRENKGVLLILLLIIALFFINIFEASGQTITNYENMTVLKDFYYCNSDESYYAYVSSSQYNPGAFKINGESNYDNGENVNKRDYDKKYTIGTNSTGYLKINGTTLSFIDDADCPISYLDFLNEGKLNIPSGATLTIPESDSICVSNIVFLGENKGKLIINGKLGIKSNSNLIIRGNIVNNNKLYIIETNVTFDNRQQNGKSVTFSNSPLSQLILKGNSYENNFIFKLQLSKQNQYLNNGEIKGEYYDVIYDIGSEFGGSNVELGTTKISEGDLYIKGQGGNGYELDVLAANKIILNGSNVNLNITDNAIFDEVYHEYGSPISINVMEGANIFVKNINNGNTFNIKRNSSFSYCLNPNYQRADWGNNSFMAKMDEGSILNYVQGEYFRKNGEDTLYTYENGDYITPISEGDIDVSNATISTPRFSNWLERMLLILMGQDEYEYTTNIQINAAYEMPSACKIAHNKDKKELLPIILVYFKLSGNNFEWETESEENNDHFVVEYSKNGENWMECTDPIHSQSNTGWIYSCPVPESTKGSVFSYYRLKQVDFDGKTSYSDIISTSWKIKSPQDRSYPKTFITIDGKILYDYEQLPSGIYIEKSENGIRRIVKLK